MLAKAHHMSGPMDSLWGPQSPQKVVQSLRHAGLGAGGQAIRSQQEGRAGEGLAGRISWERTVRSGPADMHRASLFPLCGEG